MYLSFYGLKEAPFTLNTDPDFLYLSEMHQAALSQMECSLLNQAPFTVLSGNIGMGKTTLIRHLLNLMDADQHYTVGLVTNTHPSVDDLLQWILFSFQLDFESESSVKAHQIFYDFLVSEYSKNRHVILIVDEAQNLNVDALEELRLISNINIEKQQVLQIFIVGQESLLETLKKPELTQFAQRVAYSYHLEPFNRFDTHAYIQHRLEIAGTEYRQIFSIAASDMVYHYSKGIPRLINVLCDAALIYGYAEDRLQIDADLIDSVVFDKKQEGILPLSEKTPSFGDQIPDEIISLYTTMAENATKLEEQRLKKFEEQRQKKLEEQRQKKLEVQASDSNQTISRQQSDHSQQITNRSVFVSADKSMRIKQTLSQSKIIQDSRRLLLLFLSKIKNYWQRFPGFCLASWLRLQSWIPLKWEFLKKRCMVSWKRMDNWRLVKFQNLAPLKKFATPLNGGVILLSLSCLFIGYWIFNHPQSQKIEVANEELIAPIKAHLIKEQPNLAKINTPKLKEKHELSDQVLPFYQSKKDTPEIISPVFLRSSQEKKVKEKHELSDQALLLYQRKKDTPEIISPVSLQSSKANQGSQKKVVVQVGDSLKKIIIKEFGEYNQQLLVKTLRVNPKIKNADLILVGQTINLPR